MQVNEQIRDSEVRVIGDGGEQLGVMSSRDAQRLADEKNLDLVKIAPTATPPVCRIMDYGKYRFEQAKREKEARKNQHIVEIKEVRLGLNTDIGGRELGHPEIGHEAMKKFAEACAEFASVERPSKMEGRHMLMFLAPKAAVK